MPLRSCLSPAQGAESHYDAIEDDKLTQDAMNPTLSSFMTSLQLEHLIEMFEREQITLEILAEMGHEDLKQVGVTAYGFRHKILKGIATLRSTTGIKKSILKIRQSPSIIVCFLQVLVYRQIQVHF